MAGFVSGGEGDGGVGARRAFLISHAGSVQGALKQIRSSAVRLMTMGKKLLKLNFPLNFAAQSPAKSDTRCRSEADLRMTVGDNKLTLPEFVIPHSLRDTNPYPFKNNHVEMMARSLLYCLML